MDKIKIQGKEQKIEGKKVRNTADTAFHKVLDLFGFNIGYSGFQCQDISILLQVQVSGFLFE